MRITGWPALRERVDGLVLRRIEARFRADISEHAIVAVHVRRAERLAIHRDQSLAFLARRFRHQLFEPCAEIPNGR